MIQDDFSIRISASTNDLYREIIAYAESKGVCYIRTEFLQEVNSSNIVSDEKERLKHLPDYYSILAFGYFANGRIGKPSCFVYTHAFFASRQDYNFHLPEDMDKAKEAIDIFSTQSEEMTDISIKEILQLSGIKFKENLRIIL